MLVKARNNSFLSERKSNWYYREIYLRSDHWESLREEKLAKSAVCEKCGSPYSLDVHHKDYKELYDVRISDLETLCRKCHKKVHKKRNKHKNKNIRKKIKRERRLSQKEIQKGLRALYNRKTQDFKKRNSWSFKGMSNYVSIHY